MMTPSQINAQRFNTVNKGGYRTVEVDAFLQKLYQYYSRLYSDNNELHERLEGMSALVSEYEKSKSAIAQALIWAQEKADESAEESKKLSASIVAEASQQAENMLIVKKAEAEAYYTERTQAAEERLKAAESEFEKIKAEAESFSQQYVESVNKQAKQIIADATEKASSIVAGAYADAKAAREKADEIIAQTNNQLNEFKAEIAKLKKEMNNLISSAGDAVEKISVDEDFSMEAPKEKELPELDIKVPEFSEFTYENEALNNLGEITQEAVEVEEKEETVAEKSPEELSPIDLISEQDDSVDIKSKPEKAEIPDVNSYISKIFDTVATEKKEKIAKFSIDYKADLDNLIAEVLENSSNEEASDDVNVFDDEDLFDVEVDDLGEADLD